MLSLLGVPRISPTMEPSAQYPYSAARLTNHMNDENQVRLGQRMQHRTLHPNVDAKMSLTVWSIRRVIRANIPAAMPGTSIQTKRTHEFPHGWKYERGGSHNRIHHHTPRVPFIGGGVSQITSFELFWPRRRSLDENELSHYAIFVHMLYCNVHVNTHRIIEFVVHIPINSSSQLLWHLAMANPKPPIMPNTDSQRLCLGYRSLCQGHSGLRPNERQTMVCEDIRVRRTVAYNILSLPSLYWLERGVIGGGGKRWNYCFPKLGCVDLDYAISARAVDITYLNLVCKAQPWQVPFRAEDNLT
jgi:hypothetical protein